MLLKRLVLAALTLCLMQGVAWAGTVTITFTGGPRVDVHYGGLGGSGGTLVQTYAGDFLITNSTTDPVAGIPSSFYSFCVDLQHWLYSPVPATLDSMANWNLLAGVTEAQKKGASYLANQYFSLFPTGASTDVAASYQLAIWELLYERDASVTSSFGSWTVAGGTTYYSVIDTTIESGAQALIRGINTNSPMYGYAGLLITEDYPGGYSQNFIAPVPDGGTTLLLLGGALMGVGVLRRRIRA